MPTPPEQYKKREDFTVAEIVAGDPHVETIEFRRYRADVLRAGGLQHEADAAEPDAVSDVTKMTAAEHFERQRVKR